MSKLRVKIYADGADLELMKRMDSENFVSGFTTNPTLMARNGIKDYLSFAKQVLTEISNKSISFEVFSDDLENMEKEARIINSWGGNTYIKIPITNSKGQTTIPLIKKLSDLIIQYKKILTSRKELLKVINNDLNLIKEKYSNPRRTKIIDAILNYDIEETIQKESVIITVTLQGYIKRGALSSVRAQKRGGKGKAGIKTREQDSVVQTLSVNTHTSVLFFSTEGLVYKLKAWKIPEGTSISRGKSLYNILPLKNHQSISSIMPLPEEKSEWKNLNIVFATSKGKIRKNSLEDFININASGKIAMKLDPDDKIIGVKICREDQDIILSSLNGKSIRFNVEKIRLFKGRSSKGIRGINLKEKDMIVSLSTIDKDTKNGKKGDKFILSITENGFGKRTASNDFRVTNRGGKGIIGIVNSSRNGNVSSSFPVFEGDEILISTNKGRVIRVAVKEIRIAGRNTQGVRIIRLSGDEKVVSAIKIDDNLV